MTIVLKLLLSVGLLLTVASCSSKRNTSEQSAQILAHKQQVELTSEIEFAADEGPSELSKRHEIDPDKSGLVVVDEVKDDEIILGEPLSIQTYTVKETETLMLIAFRFLGDYKRWREIIAENPGIDPTKVAKGQQIKIRLPKENFLWRPEGTPYLIKRGDTLGKISRKKYGVLAWWREIWNNNLRLIPDPNKIFAGFTIYCKERDRRTANNN